MRCGGIRRIAGLRCSGGSPGTRSRWQWSPGSCCCRPAPVDGPLAYGPRGRRCPSPGRDLGGWRWCGRGDTGRRACRWTGPTRPRGTAASWAAMKSASLTSAACAGRSEMTQPSGRFHRYTCLWLAAKARTYDCPNSTERPVRCLGSAGRLPPGDVGRPRRGAEREVPTAYWCGAAAAAGPWSTCPVAVVLGLVGRSGRASRRCRGGWSFEPPGDGVRVQGCSDDAGLVVGAGDDDLDEAVGQFGVRAVDSDAR